MSMKKLIGELQMEAAVPVSAKKSPMTDAILKKVSKMTDQNYHTEANLLVAETFKFPNLIRIFKALVEIESIEQYQPSGIAKYFYEKHVQMRDRIEHEYGKDERDRVSGAL